MAGAGRVSIDTQRAVELASALDVCADALTVEGNAICQLLTRWGGDPGRLSAFPRTAGTLHDSSLGVRRRARTGQNMQHADALMMSITGVAADINSILANPEYNTYKKTVGSVPSILSGIEAGLREYERLKAMRALNAVADRTDNVAGLVRLFTNQRLWSIWQDWQGPWQWQQKTGALLEKIGLGRLAADGAPGEGFIAGKVLLPLTVVSGLWQTAFPADKGGRGIADRVTGFAQAWGAGAVMADGLLGMTPGVGWAILGGVAAYQVGGFLWDHRRGIEHGLSIAWHATTHGLSTAWHATTHFVSKLKFW